MGQRLFLSTISPFAPGLASTYGLGLELADFCTASNLDQDFAACDAACRSKMAGVEQFWFHGPFAELCPAAIDPLIRKVTAKRYRQAIQTALDHGIHRVVLHGGFVPQVYFPQWFVPEGIKFWKMLLQTLPDSLTIALENVMEPDPDLLLALVQGVDDPRLGLCLDVGHANLTGVPPLEWILPMAPWLRHVHLHNNDGHSDQHQELDQGTIPMRVVLETLTDRCPDATWTMETQDGRRSLQWLEKEGLL